MASQHNSLPEWSHRIRRLLRDLELTQASLAERLGVSPATVSRWIQGRNEPTAQAGREQRVEVEGVRGGAVVGVAGCASGAVRV